MKFKDKILQDHAEKRMIFSKVLSRKVKCNFSPRTIRSPGKPVISNCGIPAEKASEFLDNQLKEVMQCGWSYIKDSIDFVKKIKYLKNIPDNALLVTAD